MSGGMVLSLLAILEASHQRRVEGSSPPTGVFFFGVFFFQMFHYIAAIFVLIKVSKE